MKTWKNLALVAIVAIIGLFGFIGCGDGDGNGTGGNSGNGGTGGGDTVINIKAITGVTAPVTGATAVVTITANDQYSGTVAWSPELESGKFKATTAYTATITLTAKSGYTLQGVTANFFTVAGAAATNAANSGVVTAVFPATGAAMDTVPVEDAFTSIEDLLAYLEEESNSTATLYAVKLNVDELPEGVSAPYSTLQKALMLDNKYVSLDLSGSSFNTIPSYAFAYCTSLESVTIPNSVTSMEILAFAYCTNLTSVTIPNSVTSIPNSAFAYCINLTSVIIPDSVTTIDHQAFVYCTNLTSIDIPASVTSIQSREYTSMGGGAFYYCTSLTSINVHSDNTAYSSTDGVLFNKGKTSLVVYPAGKTDATYTIPNSVTSIESGAFAYCTSLASVTIPNSVTTIEVDAFSDCTSLESVTIPNSVTTIEGGAFRGTSLESVTIPDSVTTIGSSAFSGCTSLTSVTFEGDIAVGVGSDEAGSFTGFSHYAFAGNLYTMYFIVAGGGVGTYKTTTPVPSNPDDWNPVWMKQP